MKMLTVENVTKTYGEKQLFNNISITIGEKERVGLIGINGTGKSSLLKIIAGLDQPDDGKIITGKDYSIAFLDQQPDLDSAKTVLEQVFHGEAPILRLVRE
jgi:ABC transport system ATP-binding/permease protein